jgi:hypothetical protein
MFKRSMNSIGVKIALNSPRVAKITDCNASVKYERALALYSGIKHRPNKNINSWFQVSQPCFIWVGRLEKRFI